MYEALLAVARQSPREGVENTRTVLLDLRDVASTDLSNSDAAYLSFMESQLTRLGARTLVDAEFVWVIDGNNPSTQTIVERQRRIGHSPADHRTSRISADYASALETLGLSANEIPELSVLEEGAS